MSIFLREKQGSLLLMVNHVDLGPIVQENLTHSRLALPRCVEKRSLVDFILLVDIGVQMNHPLDALGLPVPSCVENGRLVERVSLV